MENGEISVRHLLLTLFIFWNAVFQERGTVSNAKAPGKARETSKRTDRLIKRECEKNPFMSTRYLLSTRSVLLYLVFFFRLFHHFPQFQISSSPPPHPQAKFTPLDSLRPL